ncbi:MAG: formylglycine-generating enzyme family protein [Ignavibacteria bacterium]|jgi:formylglycine-generating enzyme required for sulfatase activity|nr:formylglycine-generating enzyme family protein [Ignavibacteria bacterium]
MKKALLALSLTLLLSLTACYESELPDFGGEPIIYKIQDTVTCYMDVFAIYGENLVGSGDSNYVVFNDTLRLYSSECEQWTQSKITLVMPKLPYNSTVYVVVNGKKVYYDKNSHYYQNILVNPYPEFATASIPAGTYNMGCADFGIANEMPVHKVILTRNLLVSTCEVTQRLYRTLMNANPSDEIDDTLPVYNVEWLDAVRFCNKLSIADGLQAVYTIIDSPLYVSYDATAKGWRLPTEAEWEYFSQMDSEDNTDNAIGNVAWYSYNSGLIPHSCGQLNPNKYGLYDVLGNVWEWCWDYYDANYYGISPQTNPMGAMVSDSRVYRGGSVDDAKLLVRPTCRISTNEAPKIGIRIVRNN